ncbi:uncharacterized protein LOC127253834 [Andrographis paniculata]|uniref:uncharacterized protein LOC127253834 n=1 Tax=Andrographis paniculata TaxID=175694 RepID=UPI0021E79D9E|nr:uncharacterized protein LOC127253834 [Andrographis paniculata]
MAGLLNYYLCFYNLFQAFGWSLSLLRILSDFFSTKSVNGAYSSSGGIICFVQSLAFMEVIHGATGIVSSGALLPFLQWSGRTHYVLAIVRGIPEIQQSPSVFITFLSWSLSEIIRYSFYALNCMGTSPKWITFIRYNAFIVLYPIGLSGEMWLMYKALPIVKDRNLYTNMLPFSYYNFLAALLFCYPFLWMKLYLYLFKQRATKLGKQRKKKST